MKVILRIFIIIILLLVLIPTAIVGAALIKDTPVPTYLENFDESQFDSQKELETKLEAIMMSNILGNKNIKVNEEFVAKFLFASTNGFEKLKVDLSEKYNLRLTNVWFTFDNNVLSLYGMVALNNTKTTFTAKLEFKDYDGYTEIKLHTIKIGKLPISKSILSWGVKKTFDENELEKLNPYGQINIDNLTITIEDKYINEQLKNALKKDLIIFKSINFASKEIIMYYDFSVTPEANAFNLALQDINNIIKNKKTSITNEINNLNIDNKTKESIDAVLSMLETKINLNTELTFTNDELEIISNLTTNFSNLSNEQANQVSEVFINEFDNLQAIEDALKDSDTSLTQLINQFLGKK